MSQTLETLINKEEFESLNEGLIEMMTEIFTPNELKQKYILTDKAKETILETRKNIARILSGLDNRLLIITGPCSIDDPKTALEYATKMKELGKKIEEKGLIVMRTYFEKPRTTVGWKGLIYDPRQDGSNDMEKGLEIARKLLVDINELGVGCATEFLSPFVHPYISDLISYGAIGARTTESQIHREFVSALPLPVGFKNATSGSIQTAINSIIAAKSPQTYLGASDNGRIALIKSQGNKNAHLILRGTSQGPNYYEESVKEALESLKKKGLTNSIIIDASHANSNKDYTRQPLVVEEVLRQRQTNPAIKGIMLESYLVEGSGKERGQSRTDACISYETTRELANKACKRAA